MHRITKIIGFLIIAALFSSEIKAQQSDSTSVRTDTTLQQSTATSPNKQSRSRNENIKDAVRFQSSDSLIFRLTGKRLGVLFGSAQVTHEEGELNAGKISLNLDDNTVEARSSNIEDTLSYPVLKREIDEIKSTRILFNYQTQKGKFESAFVQIQDGNLIGTQVKNVSESEVFIKDGIYSTCPADHLYYYIKARKMKVVDQDEIFFSDARLYILDIPYPFIFPFGYVPADIQKTKSGLLTPTYVFNNTSTRGIGLQNMGWFQYFNDYLAATASVDMFTSGTFFTNGTVNYRKTDAYDGRITLGYSIERGLESTDADFTKTTNRRIALTHNQKFSPYSSISSSIDLRTSDYFRRNSFDIDDRAQLTSNSKLSYNYRQPDGNYSFGINTQLAQNFSNSSTSLTGPNATFSLKALSPFQRSTGNNQGKKKFYESLNLTYRNNFRSDFRFNPIDGDSSKISFFDALFSPSDYREATGNDAHYRFGFQQVGSVGLNDLLGSQFLNASASLNFTELWYPTQTLRTFNTTTNQLETERERGFFTAREFNTNLSLNTTFYGISNRSIGRLKGFRHTVRPTVSYIYRPDFSEDVWGFYDEVQIDSLGNTRSFSRFDQEVFGGPGRGEQQALSFNIQNIFETKLVDRDTTGEVKERNLRLIDDLSANARYNFAADSLKLSQLRTNMSSTVVNGINFRATATFSFYERDSLGREFDQFLWADGGKVAQLQTLNLSAGTSFSGGRRGVKVTTPKYRKVYDPFNQAYFNPVDPYFFEEPIINRADPWSVTLNFNYQWNYRFNDSPRRSATFNANNISFNLTPLWSFSTRLGYDFIQQELTPSQFNLTRIMECWTLSFQINPFGDFQYYFFRLQVNSAQIQSLFQKLPLLNNLERNSSPTGTTIYR